MTRKKYCTALLFGFLIMFTVPVYTDPGDARNNLRTGSTRINDLGTNINWDYGKNKDILPALEMAAHSLWLADQNQNWDPQDPQKPKGPFEKAFILGAINEALDVLKKMSKMRLDGADNVNATLQSWVTEAIQKLEAAKKELENNFYGTPQHVKDALNQIIDTWSNSGKASDKAKQAGRDAAENLCQWQANPQAPPGTTPKPPWTPPQDEGKPVPTHVGGKEVPHPKKRLTEDLDKILKDINEKNWKEFEKLPQKLREGFRQPTNVDEAIKLVKALRALAGLLGIPLKPIDPKSHIYVCASPPGGWRQFPGGTPVPTGPPGSDIQTVIVDSHGPDLMVHIAMNGPIETKEGKEISLLIDRDSNPGTGSQEVIYSGLGVDLSVGLYCTASSPAAWHMQIWEVVKGEWILKDELDSSLWEISISTAEFTVPDFKETLGIESHYFSWILLAYEDNTADVAPAEPVTSFMEVSPEEFSVVAQGVDYDLNSDFATHFAEYTSKTENPFSLQLGGPAIHDGWGRDYGIFFLKDEGGHYARITHEENEYTCTWGEVDYCVLTFEVSQSGITVRVGGITRYGTRAGLYWLMDHWKVVAPSEKSPLVMILMWTDENGNGTVDADETAEVEVISPQP